MKVKGGKFKMRSLGDATLNRRVFTFYFLPFTFVGCGNFRPFMGGATIQNLFMSI